MVQLKMLVIRLFCEYGKKIMKVERTKIWPTIRKRKDPGLWSQRPSSNHVLPPMDGFWVQQKFKTKTKPYLLGYFEIYISSSWFVSG